MSMIYGTNDLDSIDRKTLTALMIRLTLHVPLCPIASSAKQTHRNASN